MSCSKCIYIISSNCLTWQCNPLWLAWLFSQSQSEGQGYENVQSIAEVQRPFPGNISRLQSVTSQTVPARSRKVGTAGLREGTHTAWCSWALALKEAGPQEWQSRKAEPRNPNCLLSPLVPSSSFIFQHFTWLCSVERTPCFIHSFMSSAVVVMLSALVVSGYQDSFA